MNASTPIQKFWNRHALRDGGVSDRVGAPLEARYLSMLTELGNEPGVLGAIFFEARNRIQDPAKRSRLVRMINAESWVGMDANARSDLHEGLLQKTLKTPTSCSRKSRRILEAALAAFRDIAAALPQSAK